MPDTAASLRARILKLEKLAGNNPNQHERELARDKAHELRLKLHALMVNDPENQKRVDAAAERIKVAANRFTHSAKRAEEAVQMFRDSVTAPPPKVDPPDMMLRELEATAHWLRSAQDIRTAESLINWRRTGQLSPKQWQLVDILLQRAKANKKVSRK